MKHQINVNVEKETIEKGKAYNIQPGIGLAVLARGHAFKILKGLHTDQPATSDCEKWWLGKKQRSSILITY